MTATQLDRIEWKLDQILALMWGNVPTQASMNIQTQTIDRPDGEGLSLANFTTKQHCVLQMLLHGKSNDELADRFGVSPNTAKVYVRTIAKKLGVNTRAQIVMKTLEDFNAIDDNSYRIVSGGMPKDWDENWETPDPFVELYGGYGGKGESKTESEE